MHFIVIYVKEAHATDSGRASIASNDIDGNPLYQPETYEVRAAQALQMSDDLEVTVPVLVDEMDNAVGAAYGSRPNNAYLIDTDGIIQLNQLWYNLDVMETAIDSLLEL